MFSTGAALVHIFEHTVRRPDPSRGPLREPLKRVHVDRSPASVVDTVRRFFPVDAERLLKSRYQVINAWQPIRTIRKDPLALMDATSVTEADKISLKVVFPDRVDEGVSVRYRPSHRWFYLHEQTPAEVMLFKIFDTDGRARAVPHSAFVNPKFEAEAPRESIEIRALVFYD